ncbi:MAG: serine/threonine-protein kinase [Candidatus Obscuribacterales bacterium]
MEEPRVLEGRFELLEEIGRGGRGVVYRGWHRLLDRAVAIKVLHAQSAQDADALKEFRREARILADLKHPHIVEVHAVGAMPESAAPYVVMEFVSGKTLAAILQAEHPLPFKRCVDLAVQTAQGLQYAHERGIVHRDLKPANIMVEPAAGDGSEHIKIVDFGLAREETVGSGATLTRVVGSPPYMSPEQCMGKRATNRSDLYSFGCVLYETLCGVPPFVADSGIETMQQHMNSAARQVSDLRRDVPDSLASVVANLLAKSPESRYATAAEVETDLRRIGEFLAGVTPEPNIEVRTDKPLPAHKDAAARTRKRAMSRLVMIGAILVLTPILIVVARHLMARGGDETPGSNDKPTNQVSFPEHLTLQQRYRILRDSTPR